MESVAVLPEGGLDAAGRIIDVAEGKGVRLRLIGGLAFKLLCPSANSEKFRRENKDIDLMGKREDVRAIVKIMETLGYKPREIFNKLNMGQRLIYYDMLNMRRVDLFLDEFIMCHKFNFKESLLAGMRTLPITQLVMTKLQVVEMTDKEFLDLEAAFNDFDVASGGKGIRGDEISELCAKDWGMYTTFRKSLHALCERIAATDGEGSPGAQRVRLLIRMMDERPKTLGWKMRARVGERTRWYELPDTDGDAVFG
ncbi:MAG: hypothetical protein HY296_02235 [Thaumarchaeota archaeon]|nr:hypothetical protein [Nitrososphaerota archaeon]